MKSNQRQLWKLTAMSILWSSTVLAADATLSPIEKAFKNGTASGHIGLYGEYTKLGKGVSNTNSLGKTSGNVSYLAPSASFIYESAPIRKVSFGAGAWTTDALYEGIKGDYDGSYANAAGIVNAHTVLHTLFAKVEHEGLGFVSYGRQEVDLQWATDYIQGLVANVTPIANLSVTAFWASKRSVVGFDEISTQFTDMNGNKGVYGLDVSYKVANIITLNPYYYYSPKFVHIPGVKLIADVKAGALESSTMFQYAVSKVDKSVTDGTNEIANMLEVAGSQDGSWIQVEETLRLNMSKMKVDAGAGFIKTDKKGGAGLIGAYGDQNPLEEGNHTFEPNAQQIYVFANCGIGMFNLGVMYGHTSYDSVSELSGASESFKDNEIDVKVGADLTRGFGVDLVYAYVNDSFKDATGAQIGSYNVVKGLFSYKF